MPEKHLGEEKQDPMSKYEEYKKKNPDKNVRADMKDDGIIQNQNKSYEVALQEFISHKQNFRENFSKEEAEVYYKKRKQLRYAKQKAYRFAKTK